MTLKRALISNWLLYAFLTLGILAGLMFEFYPLQSLEYKVYDFMAGLRQREDVSPVVIVEIDDKSIENIGTWPWPRSYLADMVRRLSGYGVNALGIYLLYSDKELNAGLEEIKSIRETLRTTPSLGEGRSLRKIDEILAESEKKLNHDAGLMSAVKPAHNVVLPLRFTPGDPEGDELPSMPACLKKNSLSWIKEKPDLKTQLLRLRNPVDVLKDERVTAREITATYSELARKAGALGHINLIPDRDGKLRRVPLMIKYQGRYFPSFALQVAAKYVGGSLKDLKTRDAGDDFSRLQLKSLEIPTDTNSWMLIDYNGRRPTYTKFSFTDVLDDKIPTDSFRKKIALVGITAKGLTPLFETSVHPGVPGVEIAANVVENIVNQKHLSRPAWAFALEVLVILYLGVFLLFVIPSVTLRVGASILGIGLVTWVGAAVFLFMAYGYWLKVFAPILLSVLGYSVAVYERASTKKQDESMEANKALGLSLQGQGMLDMAFEKFLKCPVEDELVKEVLFNLGLDFERKRMFNKALAVYEHILKAGEFKDIKDRIQELKSIGQTVALTVGSSKQGMGILMREGKTKPTLGRYEILRELGQGAMGTVYLGKDPKINREVAIKTLRYEEVPNELEEVKARFFREAEAAGKLSHPNIVTIFDVGEDHDMAYMAMELLNGEDLSNYCLEGNLLPVERVLGIISSVAEALSYAHSQGVVHRDIKPANTILLENDQVKVADFGIARVMDISETQTGVVFGTPAYMSPEQVAGKKVDGRSDLFSLGVVFYELLTGEKPFKGDSITDVMYAIAKASYTPVAELVPDVRPCCVEIVDKLLAKGVTKRLNPAAKVVKEIQLCLDKLS
jgi:CHASE2 domain-containing sensor protein/tRNA A-37 threonylcarbamoyl transferase component Bud32